MPLRMNQLQCAVHINGCMIIVLVQIQIWATAVEAIVVRDRSQVRPPSFLGGGKIK